ncbi:MAG: hypothetical protein IID38_02325 [Planctomycetes bacterium]|nr:hypothetical protein [Planctomycetota bacterium]
MRQQDAQCWHVGLTKFVTRMLGEPVELDFEVEPSAEMNVGQVIGWLEGFKAVTDVYCVLPGQFEGVNPGRPTTGGVGGMAGPSQ